MSKYRIIEAVSSYDGSTEWRVQHKCLFIWWTVTNIWTEEPYDFGSYEKAKEYIDKESRDTAARICKVREEC